MMIHFLRPQWLLMLLPAILYLTWVIYYSRQNNPWRKICDPHLLQVLLQPSPSTSRRLLHSALFSILIIAIFALAGPSWERAKLPVYRDASATMLVLDLSSAMLSTDLKPDRLTRAKFKIRDLINASKNTEMGLVVFSGEAFVAAPLSQDANTLNGMLDELGPEMMPLSGSDMATGLMQGLELLKQTAIQHSSVLLITASEPTANSWNTAKAIHQSGNQLNVLAMIEQNQTNQTLIKNLQQLANAGGGTLYLFSSDAKDIQSIVQDTSKTQSIKDDNVENAYLWQDAGPWFCLLLIPLILFVLREKAL